MAKTFENTVAVGGIKEKEGSDYAFESETVISYSNGDPTVHINTTLLSDITRLLKNPLFVVESDIPGKPGMPRQLVGTLPPGSVRWRLSERKKSSTGGYASAVKCSGVKVDGSPCQSIANKKTGMCPRHSKSDLTVAV